MSKISEALAKAQEPGPAMRVFILEDDLTRVILFREALMRHDVTHAESLTEAVEMYRGPYDLLLLDHDLGGEVFVDSEKEDTGAGFCRWVSGEPTTVLIHSYNAPGAAQMNVTLVEKGWANVGYVPFGLRLLNHLRKL
jgi:hypothetical protein